MVHDSGLGWEVAWQWDTEVKYVVAINVPSTELPRLIAHLLSKPKVVGHRTAALSVTRTDVATYAQQRKADRKGRRRHPVEKEWQQVCAAVSKEQKQERLEDGRRAKVRRVGSTGTDNITAYLERHRNERP